jgi:hypothetical protein
VLISFQEFILVGVYRIHEDRFENHLNATIMVSQRATEIQRSSLRRHDEFSLIKPN